MPPSWRSFWGYLFLLYGCSSCFSLSSTVIIFSICSFHREAKGKKKPERKYLSWHICAPLSPRLATLYWQKSEICFSLCSPPTPLKRPSLEAARARAYYLEIQSCISLVLCADGKTGERTIISEHPATQRISWIPWATNRWITKCFTIPVTSLGLGKLDFCLHSSKLLLVSEETLFPTNALRAVSSIIIASVAFIRPF